MDPLKKRSEGASAAIFDLLPSEIARKAGICADVLEEARKLAQPDKYGPLVNQLVARACELLDDIDEILVALDPESNGQEFAIAATLHRQLEQLQAAISAQQRATNRR
jgi:hypothetical protein